MNSEIKLTDTQLQILKVAVYRPDGNIEPLPSSLRGGARVKVIEGLLTREMIQIVQQANETRYCLTDAAYEALGRKRIAPAPTMQKPVEEAVVGQPGATAAPDQSVATSSQTKSRTREHSKQATVIEMLKRPEGATIQQICDATGWQQHTVRGTFAGAFKKKLGLDLVSAKEDGGERFYRIA